MSVPINSGSPELGDEKKAPATPVVEVAHISVERGTPVHHGVGMTGRHAVDTHEHKGDEDEDVDLTPPRRLQLGVARQSKRRQSGLVPISAVESILQNLRSQYGDEIGEGEEEEGKKTVSKEQSSSSTRRRSIRSTRASQGQAYKYPVVDHTGTPVRMAASVNDIEEEEDIISDETPPNHFPNPLTASTAPPQPKAYSAGVDLTEWAEQIGGHYLRPSAEKPEKFYDQPLIGIPNAVSRVDGHGKTHVQQTLKEWFDSVDVYFMLCGLKDVKVLFLYAMSLLGGVAKGVAESAMRNLTIIRVPSSIKNEYGVEVPVKIDLQPTTWPWLKEVLRRHYHPAQRNAMIRESLRRLVQGQHESVSSYYRRFKYLADQLFMTEEGLYGDFRAGLLEEYRLALIRVMQVRSGLPGAKETMTVTEALNIVLQEEATLKDQSQQNRSRQYGWTPGGYGRGGRNRSRFSSGGNGRNGGRGYRQNNNTQSQTQSNPQAQLSHVESQGSAAADEWNEEEDPRESDSETEDEGGQLNATMTSSSTPNRYRSGFIPSPTQQSSGGDRRRCWICNQSGHFKADCPQRGRRSAGQRGGYGSGGKGGGGASTSGRESAERSGRSQGKV